MFDFSDAVGSYARGEAGARGAIFTRREVVEFILDLAGVHGRPSPAPAPAPGALVRERGLSSCPSWRGLLACIRGSRTGTLRPGRRPIQVRSGPSRFTATASRAPATRPPGSTAGARDRRRGSESRSSEPGSLKGDFLLVELPWSFTHAVGNPPYVRQELIPDGLMAEYRARYSTIYDRADLYVPFFERCLAYLEPGGTLGFICAGPLDEEPVRRTAAGYGGEPLPSGGLRGHGGYARLPFRGHRVSGHHRDPARKARPHQGRPPTPDRE